MFALSGRPVPEAPDQGCQGGDGISVGIVGGVDEPLDHLLVLGMRVPAAAEHGPVDPEHGPVAGQELLLVQPAGEVKAGNVCSAAEVVLPEKVTMCRRPVIILC